MPFWAVLFNQQTHEKQAERRIFNNFNRMTPFIPKNR